MVFFLKKIRSQLWLNTHIHANIEIQKHALMDGPSTSYGDILRCMEKVARRGHTLVDGEIPEEMLPSYVARSGSSAPGVELSSKKKSKRDGIPPVDSEEVDEKITENYPPGLLLVRKIGEGSYSNVYSGVFRTQGSPSHECVAVKIYKNGTGYAHQYSNSTIVREIDALRRLAGHPNIIRLMCTVASSGKTLADNEWFCVPSDIKPVVSLVMEYMPIDMHTYARTNYQHHGFGLYRQVLKRSAFQILTAVDYCHKNGIIHRDIKTGNMLMDQYGNVKLIDFGLSKRVMSHKREYANLDVITLTYRPLELLIHQTLAYSFEVDTWSCGVVIAELALGESLFSTRDAMEMILKILSVFAPGGSLSTEDYPEQTLSTYLLTAPLNARSLKTRLAMQGCYDVDLSKDVPLEKRIREVDDAQQFIDEEERKTFIRMITDLTCLKRKERPSVDAVLSKYSSYLRN